jgi:large subunit ribosomal protein L15
LHKKIFNIVNIASLEVFPEGSAIGVEQLVEKGLINANKFPVKLLGDGDLKVKGLSITVHAASKAGREKIEKAGGKISIIEA